MLPGVLREAGVVEWDEEAVDQDVITARAGTVPARRRGPTHSAPGHPDLRGYQFDLALGRQVGCEGTTSGAAAVAAALARGDRPEGGVLAGPPAR
jgi:hypothetical protein